MFGFCLARRMVLVSCTCVGLLVFISYEKNYEHKLESTLPVSLVTKERLFLLIYFILGINLGFLFQRRDLNE